MDVTVNYHELVDLVLLCLLETLGLAAIVAMWLLCSRLMSKLPSEKGAHADPAQLAKKVHPWVMLYVFLDFSTRGHVVTAIHFVVNWAISFSSS